MKPDGQKLFDPFQFHITAREITVRLSRKESDVAIWDNRATQHHGSMITATSIASSIAPPSIAKSRQRRRPVQRNAHQGPTKQPHAKVA
ncbi:hypothetical protein CQ10_41200 [Bradyrhizobium valentinum]|nr:hypothetical protein CQ10_41200 [Bradyrhizobium valentinum]